MYLDRSAEIYDEKCREKYEELKKFISAKDDDGKLNDYYLALKQIEKMEDKLKDQERELERYNSFFRTLKGLLPRSSSIHDVIG